MFGETVDGIPHERFSPDDSVERAREIYVEETGERLPAGRARPAAPRDHRRLRLVELAARAGLPAHVRDPRRPRHRGERRADGVREQGRRLGDRRRVHARPVDRRAGRLRRVPRQRAGRGRRRRHPHAAAARGDARAHARGVRRSSSRRWRSLERHYRDMQDIEFTSRRGSSTSCRRASRSAPPLPRSRRRST